MEQAIQFFFDEQWCALRSYCKERDIRILGDVAIFVNYDSADVWTHPELFELDEERRMIRVSGRASRLFFGDWAAVGQSAVQVGRAARARVRLVGEQDSPVAGALRHGPARPLSRLRGVLVDCRRRSRRRSNGQWVKAPGHELFQRLKDVFGELPFIAEDLGLITPEVDELREHFGMPGMRILQFGFSDRGAHLYLPHKYVPEYRCLYGHARQQHHAGLVARRRDRGRARARADLPAADRARRRNCGGDDAGGGAIGGEPVHLSPCRTSLHLGSEARMNTPAAANGNWTWRYRAGCARIPALRPDWRR